jgi:hypothetical protein
MQYEKLWIAMAVVMAISFTVLGSVGYKAISNGPPIPSKVVTANGSSLWLWDRWPVSGWVFSRSSAICGSGWVARLRIR